MMDSESSNWMRFIDKNYSSSLLAGVDNLRKDGKFFDIVLSVDDKDFPCHKVVLAAASNYFRSMFGGLMKESFMNNVTIFGVTPDVMEALIEFCYTGIAVICENNVVDLLKAADLLQFPTVWEACCEFIASQLHSSNCLDIMDFAENMSCYKLKQNAFEYTLKNIVSVTSSPDFANLSYQTIKSIISHQNLNVEKEECAYEILLCWLKKDVVSRAKDFRLLMQHIRLPFIRRIYLLSKIEANPVIQRSALCQKLIKETKLFHTCVLDKEQCSSARYHPRPSTGIAELLITVGGCDENCDEATAVESYNPLSGQWRSLDPFAGNLRGGYATVALGNDIYVTGGSDGANVFNRVWRYNSQVNEWSEGAPMLHAREYHGSVALNSYVYVLGAEGCERYDTASNQWSSIAPMAQAVTNCSVTTCGGKIYSIGCICNSEKIVIQSYSPQTDAWEILPCFLPEMTFVPHIISLKGLLYFIREDSTEVLTFDPNTMKWIKSTAPMLQLHLGGSVTLFGGKIIVSGGYDETFGLSGAIEAYDLEENCWNIIGKMRRPMFWHGCVSIYRFVAAPTGERFVSDSNLHDFSAETIKR